MITKDRQIIAVTIISLCVVIWVAFVLLGGLPLIGDFSSKTQFSYDEPFPENSNRKVYLHLSNFEETTIDIRFSRNLELIYQIDVTLLEPASEAIGFENYYYDDRQMVNIHQIGIIDSMDIVLSILCPYNIQIVESEDLNTTVTYSNGAILGPENDFGYAV
ncbi:MAG: hypothetical protein ACW99U_12985, partial [Candidatus Thorarchaeota archaeon]